MFPLSVVRLFVTITIIHDSDVMSRITTWDLLILLHSLSEGEEDRC